MAKPCEGCGQNLEFIKDPTGRWLPYEASSFRRGDKKPWPPQLKPWHVRHSCEEYREIRAEQAGQAEPPPYQQPQYQQQRPPPSWGQPPPAGHGPFHGGFNQPPIWGQQPGAGWPPQPNGFPPPPNGQQFPPKAVPLAPSEPWATLHLLPSAPPEVIQAAFRALARLHHPDRGGNEETMRKINNAWEQLKRE